MHWDRTVARILLILSVINIARAAPAVVRPTHINVAKTAPEKRLLDNEATGGTDGSAFEPMPELVSDSDSSRYLSATTDSDSGSDRLFSASESLDDLSTSGSSHDGRPPAALSPASPAASYHEGSWTNRYFVVYSPIERVPDELESNQDSALESPDGSSHPDPALASPAGSLHQNSADSAPELPPSGPLHQDSLPGSPLHDTAPELPPSGPLHQDYLPGSPLHDTVFNDALKKKLMIYGGLGATTIVGLSVGLANGVHKLIKDTHTHGETTGRDLASSDFVSRGLGKSVRGFPDPPPTPK